MAKEWEKHEATYKKLTPAIKAHNEAGVQVCVKALATAWSNCAEGEINLADCAEVARKAGVTGTSLADFSQNKDFKAGLQLLEKAAVILVQKREALDNYCTEADELVADLTALTAAIEKDAKSLKDKFAPKKDVDGLLGQIKKDQAALTKVAKVYSAQMAVKAIPVYEKNFNKNVARILEDVSDVSDKGKDGADLPMLFLDRNLKKYQGIATGHLKKITTLCEGALVTAKTDVPAATAELKPAGLLLMALRKLGKDYEDAKKKYKSTLEGNKDKATILKKVAEIEGLCDTAEETFKDTTDKIKKLK